MKERAKSSWEFTKSSGVGEVGFSVCTHSKKGEEAKQENVKSYTKTKVTTNH